MSALAAMSTPLRRLVEQEDRGSIRSQRPPMTSAGCLPTGTRRESRAGPAGCRAACTRELTSSPSAPGRNRIQLQNRERSAMVRFLPHVHRLEQRVLEAVRRDEADTLRDRQRSGRDDSSTLPPDADRSRPGPAADEEGCTPPPGPRTGDAGRPTISPGPGRPGDRSSATGGSRPWRTVSTLERPSTRRPDGRGHHRSGRRPTITWRRGPSPRWKVEGLRGFTGPPRGSKGAAGEIVGLAGINGSGREEVCTLLFGGRTRSGTVRVGWQGARVVPVRDVSISQGVGFVPANRLEDALLETMNVRRTSPSPDLSGSGAGSGSDLARRATR